MSSPTNQVSQYKDALKLMKKKFQSTESQLNDIKAKYEALQKTLIGFLEYATKPFDESNPQPDFTSDGLRCWWDVKKQGLFLESGNATPVPVITNDSSPSVLRAKITELTAQLKKVEFEKRDLEFNLSRRTADHQSVSEKANQMKSEIDTLNHDLESTRTHEKEMEATLLTAQNQLMALFIGLSQFLDVNCEKEEEIKTTLYAAVRQLAPSKEKSEEDTTTAHSDLDLIMLNAVDKVSLLKSRHQSLQEELDLKTSLLASQDKQVKDLFSLSEVDKDTIAHLRSSLEKAQQTIHENAEQSAISSSTSALSRDEQITEYEKANANLRQALQSMRETMEQQQKRVEESEVKYMKIHEELVTVQRSSSEMVQQMFLAGEEKTKQIEEDKAKLQAIAEEATNEVQALRLTLEKTSKEYEHELAVLRERHYAVEEQVSVSEKFLDSTNRAHQKELHDMLASQRESQREVQELRVQILEKEEELKSCQESLETLRSQSREQVKVLTTQLRVAEQRMLEETTKVEEQRRSLASSETQLEKMLAEKVSAVEQKEREASRMQQRQYEEELVRTRKQVQVLSQQLEEERKNNRKTRDQLGQMSDLMTQQDRVIEKLRSDVASRESEILAGKQQINMLSMIISQKRSD